MHNYICDICGCYLDPGEKCDCQKEQEHNRKIVEDFLTEDRDGQMVLKEAADHGAHTWI